MDIRKPTDKDVPAGWHFEAEGEILSGDQVWRYHPPGWFAAGKGFVGQSLTGLHHVVVIRKDKE